MSHGRVRFPMAKASPERDLRTSLRNRFCGVLIRADDSRYERSGGAEAKSLLAPRGNTGIALISGPGAFSSMQHRCTEGSSILGQSELCNWL